jgi:hypothetical protein
MDKEKEKEKRKKYYMENREHIREIQKEYYKKKKREAYVFIVEHGKTVKFD